MNVQIAPLPQPQLFPFVDFWTEVLVPKFILSQHNLVGGLSHHSTAVMPSFDVKKGDRILDVGCDFGDTAIGLANRTGVQGKVLGVDCCQAFLDLAWP